MLSFSRLQPKYNSEDDSNGVKIGSLKMYTLIVKAKNEWSYLSFYEMFNYYINLNL